MAIVRVIFKLVSLIFSPIEKRLMRKMAAGNIRNDMKTWIQRIHES